jgi:polysaccharide export outer membrane protein
MTYLRRFWYNGLGSLARRTIRPWLLAALVVALTQAAAGQQVGESPVTGPEKRQAPIASAVSPNGSKANSGRRIGPGDTLDIRVFDWPTLSRESVRVDALGMIAMPLIQGEIRAACRTEKELAGEIAKDYLKYLKTPQVDVFVKEFQSQPVAVIGAVNAPGRFQLQRPLRLLELLTFAGGPAERAGRSIQIVHTAPNAACDSSAPYSPDLVADAALVSYGLADTLKGTPGSNPYVQSGDIITLPDADQAYVVGSVLKPSAISLKEPVSVSRAIAMAGGLVPDAKSNRIRVIRQLAGSVAKTELYVDLKAIEKHSAEDIQLQPNDIVDVPISGGKSFMRSLLGAVVPSVSQLPVRVIP